MKIVKGHWEVSELRFNPHFLVQSPNLPTLLCLSNAGPIDTLNKEGASTCTSPILKYLREKSHIHETLGVIIPMFRDPSTHFSCSFTLCEVWVQLQKPPRCTST